MEKTKIENLVIDIVCDVLEIEKNSISPAADLRDLGADSLQIVEIFSHCMRRTKIKIPREKMGELNNIAQIVESLTDNG